MQAGKSAGPPRIRWPKNTHHLGQKRLTGELSCKNCGENGKELERDHWAVDTRARGGRPLGEEKVPDLNHQMLEITKGVPVLLISAFKRRNV